MLLPSYDDPNLNLLFKILVTSVHIWKTTGGQGERGSLILTKPLYRSRGRKEEHVPGNKGFLVLVPFYSAAKMRVMSLGIGYINSTQF